MMGPHERQRILVSVDCLPGTGGNAEPGTDRFDRFSASWNMTRKLSRTEVADFHRTRTRSPIDLAVDDQSPADPRSDGQVHHRIELLSRAKTGFRIGRRISIILQDRGELQLLVTPVGQRESIPSFDLMTFDSQSLIGIDWTAERDSRTGNFACRKSRLFEDCSIPRDDLFPNAGSTRPRIDFLPPQSAQFSRLTEAQAKLQLGPTNLDAQKMLHIAVRTSVK